MKVNLKAPFGVPVHVVLGRCKECKTIGAIEVPIKTIQSANGEIVQAKRKIKAGGAPLDEHKCEMCGRIVQGAHNLAKHERACAKRRGN